MESVPKSLLVVGGGYIGLEMGTVYDALGSEVTVVEMTDGLLPGVDRDLVKPLATHLTGKFKNIWLSTQVVSLEEVKDGVEVTLKGKDVPEKMTFEKVLIAVGRRPNSDNIGLENTQATIDAQGFVTVDAQCCTSDKKILAIGDVSGQPCWLTAPCARVWSLLKFWPANLRPLTIAPSLRSFSQNLKSPRAGITETEAKAQGKEVGAAKFPWSASGRACYDPCAEPIGQTKVIYDPETTAVPGRRHGRTARRRA